MGMAKADAEMRRRIGEGQAAGVATAVVSAGEVVEACYGMLDVERRVEIQPDSLMRLYSLTKPVIGVAVMLLHEQGSLDLDAPVREWIPSFATLQVGDSSQPREALATEITVRHLLTHTAGLAWGDELLSPIMRLIHPLPTAVELLCRLPLGFQPGTGWDYSLSFDVLGYLIELVSGRWLADFLDQEIFIPLGMVDTGFSVPTTAMERFGPLYGPPDGGTFPLIDPTIGSPFADSHEPASGGAGLVSTLRDYLSFARMLSGGGQLDGVRILKPDTTQAMATNQLHGSAFPVRWDSEPGPVDTLGYGLGLGVSVGEPAKFGWGGASGSKMWIFPDRDLVALALTHSLFDFTVADAFMDALIDAD